MGPSGTFFTRKELYFCRFLNLITSAIKEEINATHAEKEPLEVGRHFEDDA